MSGELDMTRDELPEAASSDTDREALRKAIHYLQGAYRIRTPAKRDESIPAAIEVLKALAARTSQPVQEAGEETRILTIIDQHLPTVITGLQQVVYQSMHKSRDELTDDEVALRAALSAAHWIAKDLVTRNGKPLYDLPSVLDLLSMKRKDAERIAELEATVAALGGGEHE